MGRLRAWARRLEKERQGDVYVIPLPDGEEYVCTQEELMEAFGVGAARLRACYRGEDLDAVETHPVLEAAANSTSERWRRSIWGASVNPKGGGNG